MEIAQPMSTAPPGFGEVEMRRSQRSGSTPVVRGLLTLVTAVRSISCLRIGGRRARLLQRNAREHLRGITPWVGALGFLPWLRKTFERALGRRATGRARTRGARGRSFSFFIPILNLFRAVITRYALLNEALEPDRIAAPGCVSDGIPTYRHAGDVVVSERSAGVPPQPVALWWALWIGRTLSAISLR